MNKSMAPSMKELKKLQVSEAVSFAIDKIPEVDQKTLEKFLDLVNTSGTFGTISREQIETKMQLTLKYIPNACQDSLLVLADLLEISVSPFQQFSDQPLAHLPTSRVNRITLDANQTRISTN